MRLQSAPVLALALTLTLFVGVTAHPSPADAADRHATVLVDTVQVTELGTLCVRLARDRSGDLRGRLSLRDAAGGTNIVGSIRDGTLRLRGTLRGELVRESATLRDLADLARSEGAPTRAPKLTCPGKIGKLICAVAELIIAACIDDGELLGVKCSDAPDGGTSGGDSGGDGGTSTTG